MSIECARRRATRAERVGKRRVGAAPTRHRAWVLRRQVAAAAGNRDACLVLVGQRVLVEGPAGGRVNHAAWLLVMVSGRANGHGLAMMLVQCRLVRVVRVVHVAKLVRVGVASVVLVLGVLLVVQVVAWV